MADRLPRRNCSCFKLDKIGGTTANFSIYRPIRFDVGRVGVIITLQPNCPSGLFDQVSEESLVAGMIEILNWLLPVVGGMSLAAAGLKL
ncbi:MAG: hypothetical protein ACK6A8_11765, partial [Planctomycetota bacterium]